MVFYVKVSAACAGTNAGGGMTL